MRMADAGWVWEGQGLDPGVHPSIFGLGEGADFFGLSRVHFMFHPLTELAFEKLSDKTEVVCDISKWLFRDCGTNGGGSECYVDAAIDAVCAEAEKVSAFSRTFRNIAGAIYDDMKGLIEKRGHTPEDVEHIVRALKRHNPDLRLECVVYRRELADAAFWRPLRPYVDVVSLWFWGWQRLDELAAATEACRELFEAKPVRMGCYLRDYPSLSPMPMEAVRRQWRFLAEALADGRLDGFEILGAVLIDGHLEQARWVRDFIRDHS